MEELLNEDESSTLDCKRDQYAFDEASAGGDISGATSQITVSYVAVMEMKMFTIAPVA